MRATTHITSVPADVRGHDLSRYFARAFDQGKTLLVASPQSPPRLWAYGAKAVFDGVDAFLEATSAVGLARLEGAVSAARISLANRANALVERTPPDSSLVAVHLDRGKAHVVSVGSGRVYVYRRGNPSRLTPRDMPKEGLLSGALHVAETGITADDLILVGSSTAFSVRAIARLASVLDDDPNTKPSVVTALLVEPASQAGVGAAAAAMRVI